MTDNSGEGGIRTPGPVTVNGFQDRRIRPLCHLSAANVQLEIIQSKINMDNLFKWPLTYTLHIQQRMSGNQTRH